MKVAVTGGRGYGDMPTIRLALGVFRVEAEGAERPTLLVGDASGADTIAAAVARELGWDVEVFVAEWDIYGPSAGPRRNAELLTWSPDVLLAFPGGSGTANMVEQARTAGVPTFFVGKR